jgi:uncharacterized SAM-binding protein YcdF (DUF218 family)
VTASVRTLTIALLLIGLGAGLWLERETLFQGIAELWIVSDPVTRADAVVVLGGGLKYRPIIAADLYKRGLVSRVLVSRTRKPEHAELNRQALVQLGVPETAIEVFGMENSNTEKEARALKLWTGQNVASVIIVPSGIFAARRVRWIFRRVFRGTNIRIEVPSFEEGFTREGWWRTRAGLIAFRTEILKYIYYRFEY